MIKELDFYYRLLGINPNGCPQEMLKELNNRIRSVQALVNSPNRNFRERAEEEMRILFKTRGLILQQRTIDEVNFPVKTTVKVQKLQIRYKKSRLRYKKTIKKH